MLFYNHLKYLVFQIAFSPFGNMLWAGDYFAHQGEGEVEGEWELQQVLFPHGPSACSFSCCCFFFKYNIIYSFLTKKSGGDQYCLLKKCRGQVPCVCPVNYSPAGSPLISSASVHPKHPAPFRKCRKKTAAALCKSLHLTTFRKHLCSLWNYTRVLLTRSTQQASTQVCQTFSSITDNRLAIWDTPPRPSTEAINLLKWGPHRSFR